eukprot:scaffold9093_cov80-Phaeocystis_antarctica.AAC.3
MLELLRGAIVTAKNRAALTRTTQAPVKLTVQRFTGAPSLAGAAAVFCVFVAACFLIFCLASACCAAAGFVACTGFFSAFFACSLVARAPSCLAAASASTVLLRKVDGTVYAPNLLLA